MKEPTGTLIRSLRAELAMTQEEFAHAVQVTVSTVNRWENTHAEPSRLAWRSVRALATSRGIEGDLAGELERRRRPSGLGSTEPVARAAAAGRHQ
jgi:DNA-binding XRE family transcriptional regulator